MAKWYQVYFKRLIDIVLSFFGLIFLAPVILVIYVLVLITLGQPVLFRQVRPGRYAKPFKLVKFRTMRHQTHFNNQSISDEHRITKLGQFLRKTSLDELPELYNVLKGDMSLVGPRPLLMEYLPIYTSTQQQRHLVRPGITGLAQVNGRNAIDWDEKLAFDVQYVEKVSLSNDLSILFRTIFVVVSQKGVSSPTSATSESLLNYTKEKLEQDEK
jgi:undecaprenyl phosphate N,N'-diacetylbacillosamine 1-phosphate transferase